MLSLGARVIDEVMIFPDHADSLLFYYQPLRPQLVWWDNLPQIGVIQYKGQEQEGGLLTLEVNLDVEPAQLEAIRQQIGGEGIRLAPVPLAAGSAKLTILDQEYGVQHASLLSGNNVVFTTWVDAQVVTIIDQALRTSDFAPIAVFYTLDYVALRPAYSFRLDAQWERVQRRIEERIGVGLFVLSVDVQKIVESLVEDGFIKIELETFIPDEEQGQERIQERDRLLFDLQEMILHTFFEPKLQPIKSTIGGGPPLFGFSYRRIDIKQVERRSLNTTVEEQSTVRRSLYPQAYLDGIATAIQQQDLDPNTFIQRIDLDIPFFRKRHIHVIARANFEEDGIEWIRVRLTYQGETKSILLTPADDRQSVDPWNGVLNAAGQMERDVQVTYTVRFRAVDSAQRPAELTSEPWVTPFDYVEIVPRQLYTIQPIPLVALKSFPWERYSRVKVRLRYAEEAHQIRLEPTVYLDAERRSHIYPLFAQYRDPDQAQNRDAIAFQYQLTFLHNSSSGTGQDLHAPWMDGLEQVLIANPFPQQRHLTVVSLLDWEEIHKVYVEVQYQDEAAGITEQKTLQFDPSNHQDQQFTANLKNPQHQLIRYWVLIVFKSDGVTKQLPPSETLDKRLYLTPDLKAHRVIKVSTSDVDFTTHEIEILHIEMRHKNEEEDEHTIRLFSFDDPTDHAYFEFDFIDEKTAVYDYQVTYQFKNGEACTTERIAADADVVNLESRTLASFLPKPDPAARDLHITISAEGVDWEQVRSAKVRLLYVDDRSDVEEKEKFYFRDSSDLVQEWEVNLDPEMTRFYQWKVSFAMKDREVGDRGKFYYPGPGYKPWDETENNQISLNGYLAFLMGQ